MTSFGPVVSAEWLLGHLGDLGVRVVDVRWSLEAGVERDAYLAGHIPGAAFVDLEADLAAPDGPGRHPLPSRSQFEEAMRRAGVNGGSRVVVYDDAGGSIAARLWWLLRAFGHDAAAVLGGDIQAWDGPIETGPVEPPRGDFRAARLDSSGVVDHDELRREIGGILLDARSPERYTGQREPVDARAGHIPGARNAFWQDNLGEDGRFLPPGAVAGALPPARR